MLLVWIITFSCPVEIDNISDDFLDFIDFSQLENIKKYPKPNKLNKVWRKCSLFWVINHSLEFLPLWSASSSGKLDRWHWNDILMITPHNFFLDISWLFFFNRVWFLWKPPSLSHLQANYFILTRNMWCSEDNYLNMWCCSQFMRGFHTDFCRHMSSFFSSFIWKCLPSISPILCHLQTRLF